jgi:hypothetical protein
VTYTFHEAEALLWQGLKDAGLLRAARATLPDCDVTVDLDVELIQPDFDMIDQTVRSTQWEMEYVHSAAPTLAKGTEVWIAEPGQSVGRLFRVREAPRVEEEGSGYFRRALLTEQECPE